MVDDPPKIAGRYTFNIINHYHLQMFSIASFSICRLSERSSFWCSALRAFRSDRSLCLISSEGNLIMSINKNGFSQSGIKLLILYLTSHNLLAVDDPPKIAGRYTCTLLFVPNSIHIVFGRLA